jgi:hypothetical protein
MVRRADLFNREKELYLAKMAKADELQRVKTTDETAVDMNDVLEEVFIYLS